VQHQNYVPKHQNAETAHSAKVNACI